MDTSAYMLNGFLSESFRWNFGRMSQVEPRRTAKSIRTVLEILICMHISEVYSGFGKLDIVLE